MQHVACSLKKSLAEAWTCCCRGDHTDAVAACCPWPQIRRSDGTKWHGMKATSQVLSRETTLSLTFSGNPGTYSVFISVCFCFWFCFCVCLFLATAIVDSLTF